MAKKNITTKGDYITKATFKLLKYINDITDRVGYFIESFDWECIKNN